ncbi:hypothetical protein [Nocardia sp. NPDC059239]|uniref:hypothetical protein n=1 Tax=unclassified Nocardia TaxID=2637762 RepID=UPI0036A66346
MDGYCALAAFLLVVAAFLMPRIKGKPWLDRLYAGAAPIFGNWLPHIGWGTVPAVAIAAGVVRFGPDVARRLTWRPLLWSTWATAAAWAFALAMIDGWQRGFAGRLTTRDEYLYEVPGVHDIGAMLREFSGRILDFQPDSWTTHVSGHPPGALLTFVLLDRIGLGGGAWAGLLCTLAGTSAAAAVAVTVRALGSEHRARAATPFLALMPAVIWIAVSADGLFAGVSAWGIALLAIATRLGRAWIASALASGLLLGFTLFLSYGLVLIAIPAVAVLVSRSFRPGLPALVGVISVVAVFAAAGFWWPTGYHLVVQRYYQGIATERPDSYWIWGNIAATVCAVGLATAAATCRVLVEFEILPLAPLRIWFPRWRSMVDPAALMAAASIIALLAADLSGLSKAETERIWLPFDVWVLAATALLPRRSVRFWLTIQAAGALLLVHVILTNW